MKSAGNPREVGRPCACSSFFIHATKLRNNLGLRKLFGNYFHSSDEVFSRVGETQKRGKEESRHLMFPRGQEEAEDGLFLVKVYYYILTIIIREQLQSFIPLLRRLRCYYVMLLFPFRGAKVSNVYFPLFLFSAFSCNYSANSVGI